MATRNLARSVVEGGRAGRAMDYWNQRAERQAIRVYLKRIRSEEDATDAGPDPIRDPEYWTTMGDRFSQTERFMASRAGRPWNDVYSELCRRYDRRTLKGWHFLRHVERDIVTQYNSPYRLFCLPVSGAFVDAQGILRFKQRKRFGR